MTALRWALFAAALLALGAGSGVHAATVGQASAPFRIGPFVELVTMDPAVAPFAATPSAGAPGPLVWSNSDGFTFSGRWTNTRHVVTLDVPQAASSAGASTVTIQGTPHAVADWLRVRPGGAERFGTVRAAGVPDAGGAYVAPQGVVPDGSGTVALRLYDMGQPVDQGTPVTVHWLYVAADNAYWFDTVDQDFTNGLGEVRVYPLSNAARTQYTFRVSGLDYAVVATGGAASGYVPTVALAWHRLPGVQGGHAFTAFALVDFPSGAPPGGYDFTLRATIGSVK